MRRHELAERREHDRKRAAGKTEADQYAGGGVEHRRAGCLRHQRQAQVVRAETSAEMALELRTSLSTMREWAEQISVSADPMRTRSLAADLSAEAERLNKLVGGYLAGRDKARAAEA